MPLRPYIILLILLVGLWSGGGTAFAAGEIDGRMLIGVGDYRGEVDGNEVRRISTNYQQIALRYDKKGMLGDARAGKYSLMVGYEFNRLAPSVSSFGVKDDDYQEITAKKLFYQGDMLIAPGGLPFRLSLFARDIHQSAFVDEGVDGALPVGNEMDSQGSLIDPYIYTGINNGTHRELGGTLLLGIRNGSYLGLYRDVLSQLPRLLIDYKQIEVRDMSRDRYQTHYRSRDLAFVSLNKLDNWVHFRMRDYTDYLNPGNGQIHKQVIIGLIDQIMTRKWINMTNWLRVSGDLSYTVEDSEKNPIPERTYLVNMMAIGRRENVNTSILSSFSRQTDGRTLELETELPISMTADLNRDTRLRSRLIYQANQRSVIEGSTPVTINDTINDLYGQVLYDDLRDCYLDLQLETLRSRRVVVVPRFEVESRQEDIDQQGLAMRVGAEAFSNNKLNNTIHWLGGYALTTSRSDTGFDEKQGRYLENKIYGRVDKELNRRWSVGGDTSLAIGSGSGRTSMSFRIPRMSAQLATGGGNGKEIADSNDDSKITIGNVRLSLEHRHQQLENRLEVSYESLTTDNDTANQMSLRHHLNYTQRAHRFKWSSVVNKGDNSGTAEAVSFDSLSLGSNTDASGNKASWSSDATYSYDPTRSLSLGLSGAISNTKNQENLMSYSLSEKVVYRLFTVNGVIRRIGEFSEEIGYEKINVSDVNGRDSSLYGYFSAAYFPTRYIYFKLRNEMTRYSNSVLNQVNICEVGLDYEKLKLIASYTEGKKNRESAELPEVMERFWNVELRKFF